jgi:hypothetical protein
MPRRACRITQAEVARIIRAAKQAGASEVVVPIDGVPITIKLSTAIEARSFFDADHAAPSPALSKPRSHPPRHARLVRAP